MTVFSRYAESFSHIRMKRSNGILELVFHSDGKSLEWGLGPHQEFPEAFYQIGKDEGNEVIIMTGVGELFSGPRPLRGYRPGGSSATAWDKIFREGKDLLTNLLGIEVPIIAAVNGPALRHCEIPLLSDIVIASEEAEFQDSAHFANGMVPGDGMHVVMPLLLGLNRARYFLLTGQAISAKEAKEFGIVAEVLPKKLLLARAYELARMLLLQKRLIRRYSRIVLTQDLKARVHDLLGYGLALEGLGVLEASDS
jgi:enoyl-CoA hydratase/carnithine racemase